METRFLFSNLAGKSESSRSSVTLSSIALVIFLLTPVSHRLLCLHAQRFPFPPPVVPNFITSQKRRKKKRMMISHRSKLRDIFYSFRPELKALSASSFAAEKPPRVLSIRTCTEPIRANHCNLESNKHGSMEMNTSLRITRLRKRFDQCLQNRVPGNSLNFQEKQSNSSIVSCSLHSRSACTSLHVEASMLSHHQCYALKQKRIVIFVCFCS